MLERRRQTVLGRHSVRERGTRSKETIGHVAGKGEKRKRRKVMLDGMKREVLY